MRTAPDNFEARIRLAIVYERMNRLDDIEARSRCNRRGRPRLRRRQALRDRSAAWRALRAPRQISAKARALLESAGPRHAEDASHYFEVAKICDKLGETDRAMQALAAAHAIKVEDLKRVAPERAAADTEGPIALPDVSAEEYRNWPKFTAPDARNSPVFVVGFPRSGTTLLEQMLDAHPRLQSMDENPFFNRLADTLRRHDSRILGSLDVLRQYDVDELRKQYLLMVVGKDHSVAGMRSWSTRIR